MHSYRGGKLIFTLFWNSFDRSILAEIGEQEARLSQVDPVNNNSTSAYSTWNNYKHRPR